MLELLLKFLTNNYSLSQTKEVKILPLKCKIVNFKALLIKVCNIEITSSFKNYFS